jgi:hypothetical protein
MTPHETHMAALLQRAIDMLRWQIAGKITATSWAEWCGEAVEVIDAAVNQAPRPMQHADLYAGQTVPIDWTEL